MFTFWKNGQRVRFIDLPIIAWYWIKYLFRIKEKTIEGATKAYKLLGPFHKLCNNVISVWDQLSMQEVKKTISLEDLKKAYRRAPCLRESRKIALRKLINLCKTFEEAKDVYDLAGYNEETINKLIDLCKTLEDAEKTYSLIRYSSASKDLTMMKIIEFGKLQQILKYQEHTFAKIESHQEAENLMIRRFGIQEKIMKHCHLSKESFYFPHQENIYLRAPSCFRFS